MKVIFFFLEKSEDHLKKSKKKVKLKSSSLQSQKPGEGLDWRSLEDFLKILDLTRRKKRPKRVVKNIIFVI